MRQAKGNKRTSEKQQYSIRSAIIKVAADWAIYLTGCRHIYLNKYKYKKISVLWV